MAELFASVYAPSTFGSFLRTFTHGHVRQLQAVSRDILVQLAGRAPILPGADAFTFVDMDSLLRRVYGKKKQGIGSATPRSAGTRSAARLQPAGRHHQHPGRGAGDRRDPTTRRQRRLGPRRVR